MVLPTVGPVTIMTLFTFSSLSTSGIFFALSAPLTTFGPGNMASVSGSACSMILLFARHLNTVSLSFAFSKKRSSIAYAIPTAATAAAPQRSALYVFFISNPSFLT